MNKIQGYNIAHLLWVAITTSVGINKQKYVKMNLNPHISNNLFFPIQLVLSRCRDEYNKV